jgi:hypothetical protein
VFVTYDHCGYQLTELMDGPVVLFISNVEFTREVFGIVGCVYDETITQYPIRQFERNPFMGWEEEGVPCPSWANYEPEYIEDVSSDMACLPGNCTFSVMKFVVRDHENGRNTRVFVRSPVQVTGYDYNCVNVILTEPDGE